MRSSIYSKYRSLRPVRSSRSDQKSCDTFFAWSSSSSLQHKNLAGIVLQKIFFSKRVRQTKVITWKAGASRETASLMIINHNPASNTGLTIIIKAELKKRKQRLRKRQEYVVLYRGAQAAVLWNLELAITKSVQGTMQDTRFRSSRQSV